MMKKTTVLAVLMIVAFGIMVLLPPGAARAETIELKFATTFFAEAYHADKGF